MSSELTNSQPTIELKVNSPTADIWLNPDVEADIFATKTELSAVENKIPAEYVKSAAVADNKLTLTKQDNTVVEFEGGGGSYTLPVASTTTLGGVKVDGTSITIADGVISTDLPTKTSDLTNDSGFITNEYHDSTKQNVLIPGNNITISANNVISATGGGSGGSYTLPVASTTTLGGVKVGSIGPMNKGRWVSAEEDGRLYVAPPDKVWMYPGVVYPGSGLELSGSTITLEPPIKSANDKYSIGGVKPDETTTTVDEDGTIHANYTLPVATTATIGGVKPDGTTITIDSNGVISSQTAGAIQKTLSEYSLGDYLKKPENKAWIIDWANNPSKYIVDVNGCKVIRTDKSGSTFYYYFPNRNYSDELSYYYINFTNNNFTEISSNQPSWSTAGTHFLTEMNWQNYITLSGGGDWQYTSSSGDSNLYNAKEMVLYWQDNDSTKHQSYLNFTANFNFETGQTLGTGWTNQKICLDSDDTRGHPSITYNGSSITASNCVVFYILYKT